MMASVTQGVVSGPETGPGARFPVRGARRRARCRAVAAGAPARAPAWHAAYAAPPGEPYTLPVFRGNYAPVREEVDSRGALEVRRGCWVAAWRRVRRARVRAAPEVHTAAARRRGPRPFPRETRFPQRLRPT